MYLLAAFAIHSPLSHAMSVSPVLSDVSAKCSLGMEVDL